MLSQTAEYALRAVVALADGGGRPVATPELAAVTGAPPRYLAKVLQVLARRGLVRSRRGVRGGFVLAGSPDGVTVLHVVHACEPVRRAERRLTPLAKQELCLGSLFRRLDDAAVAVEATLAQTTIADLLDEVQQARHTSLAPDAPMGDAATREVVPC